MSDIQEQLEEIRELGLYRRMRLISGPQGPRVVLDGRHGIAHRLNARCGAPGPRFVFGGIVHAKVLRSDRAPIRVGSLPLRGDRCEHDDPCWKCAHEA